MSLRDFKSLGNDLRSVPETEYWMEDPFVMQEFCLFFQIFFCICFQCYCKSRGQYMCQKERTDYAASESRAICRDKEG